MRFLAIVACLTVLPVGSAYGQPVPRADHHQHLFSPAIATLISPPPPRAPVNPISADDLVLLLSDAEFMTIASNVPPYMR